MALATVVIAGAAVWSHPSHANDALKITFVCSEGECIDAFEKQVEAYLGCASVLSPLDAGSTPVRPPFELRGRANIVIKYARTMPDTETSDLIRYAKTYQVTSLRLGEEPDTSECVRLEKYDDGKSGGLVSLFQIGVFDGLSPSSKSCLDSMKASLPKEIGWCAHLKGTIAP
jgi:hypothetical protein